MQNFLFGLQNMGYSLQLTVGLLLRQQLIWGFLLGFAASTLVHFIIISDHPEYIRYILTHSAPESFLRLTERNPNGTYTLSYSYFRREHNRVRLVFYSTIGVFLVVVAIALLKY